MEMNAHQRLMQPEGSSFASGNFDVKYYRCQWEIDPSVRYIKGAVTIYFTITTASTSITLDLMNTLITDSVKQRGIPLSFDHANNSLQVNFPASINAGVLDSVTVYYRGVPAATGFGSFIQSTHAGTPVMWSLSEAYGSRDW